MLDRRKRWCGSRTRCSRILLRTRTGRAIPKLALIEFRGRRTGRRYSVVVGWHTIGRASVGRADRRGRGPSGLLAEGEQERTSTALLPFSAPTGDENSRGGRPSAKRLSRVHSGIVGYQLRRRGPGNRSLARPSQERLGTLELDPVVIVDALNDVIRERDLASRSGLHVPAGSTVAAGDVVETGRAMVRFGPPLRPGRRTAGVRRRRTPETGASKPLQRSCKGRSARLHHDHNPDHLRDRRRPAARWHPGRCRPRRCIRPRCHVRRRRTRVAVRAPWRTGHHRRVRPLVPPSGGAAGAAPIAHRHGGSPRVHRHMARGRGSPTRGVTSTCSPSIRRPAASCSINDHVWCGGRWPAALLAEMEDAQQ